MIINIPLLRASAVAIKPVATEFATKFYAILFETYPEASELFSATDLENQKAMLMAGIVGIVDMVDNAEKLVPYLKSLGARHTSYGTRPEHYPMVGDALMKTLRFFFREQWSPDLESTWTNAYQVISETMLAGANEAEKEAEVEAEIAALKEAEMTAEAAPETLASEPSPELAPEPASSSSGPSLPPNLNEWLGVWAHGILKEAISKMTNSPQFKAEMEKISADLLDEYIQKQASHFSSEFKKAV